MKKTNLPAICTVFGMLILIFDSKTALDGAKEGITLCMQTVVPSLFPFFVLSSFLAGHLVGKGYPFLRPVGLLTGIPRGTESILLIGFLGGYPVGAQAVNDARMRGQLSSKDARRMLAFCNNCGPAFLFGMASSLFPCRWASWALWGIHVFSSVLVGILLPGKSNAFVSTSTEQDISLSEALTQAVRVMGSVCGWVILFRILICFVDRWFRWCIPYVVNILIAGLLELSNGCCALKDMDHIGARFVLCSTMLAFGGLCVSLQTISVSKAVDTGWYIPGKLLQALFSTLLAVVVQQKLPGGTPVHPMFWLGPAVLFSFAFLLINRKRSSILAQVSV